MADGAILVRDGLGQDKGVATELCNCISNFVESALRITGNGKAEEFCTRHWAKKCAFFRASQRYLANRDGLSREFGAAGGHESRGSQELV